MSIGQKAGHWALCLGLAGGGVAMVAAPAWAQGQEDSAQGWVRDAVTGSPISGALVQQSGGVASGFSAQDGRFRVFLERQGPRKLTVSAVGYDDATLDAPSGSNLVVLLKPAAGFIPAAPPSTVGPVGASPAELAPLHSSLSFGYRLRLNEIQAPGLGGGTASIGGLSNNDFRLAMRLRLRPFLIEGEGNHTEMPVELPGLRREENPAFTPSTWAAGLRGGMLFPFHSDLEGSLLAAYRWTNVVPNNNDVRYTGSPIDFEQSRHAFGGQANLAWRPGRGRFHAETGLGLYPVLINNTDTNGSPFADKFLTEFRAIAGYEVVSGFRLGLSYHYDRFQGSGFDAAHMFGLVATYTPGGVPRVNE